MSDCYMHNSKGVDVNDVHNSKPDTNCTCDGANGSERGAGKGPATDPKLLERLKICKMKLNETVIY